MLSRIPRQFIHLNIFLALVLSLILSSSVMAQSTQTAARPDRGLTTGASYSISDIENINMVNGNVGLSIPLASLPAIAGGKLSWTVYANYNSKLWDMTRSEAYGTVIGCPPVYTID